MAEDLFKQFGGSMESDFTEDNKITNSLVDDGSLPESQRENIPQGDSFSKFGGASVEFDDTVSSVTDNRPVLEQKGIVQPNITETIAKLREMGKSEQDINTITSGMLSNQGEPQDETLVEPTRIQKGALSVDKAYRQLGGRIEKAAETTKDVAVEGFEFGRSGAEDIVGAVTGEPTYDPRTDTFKETPEDTIGRVAQGSTGLGKLIGGAFETVFSPFAAPVGFAEPEVQAGAEKFLETRTPEQKQAMAQLKEVWDQATPQEKDSLRALTDFLGVTTAKTLKPGATKVLEKGATALTEELPKAGKAILETVEAGKEITEKAIKTAKENKLNKSLLKLDSAIDKGIEKGIRPSLTGEKKTIGGMAKFQEKARDAVKLIAKNEEKLKLFDEFGDPVKGTPKTVKQFADSIDQNKKRIYQEYSALSKLAGETRKLPLNRISEDLNLLVNNKVLKNEAPDIIAYAQKRIDRYAGQTYTPQQAEEAIKLLNQSLDTYYKRPSYESASKAYVDALVANNLRKNLDSAIEGATGGQYQALKNQYSSLKAIEKDVVHRALVDARKSNKNLIDFTDIFTGGEAVAGILSLNPTLMAKAGAQKGIKEWMRWLNDPNVIIKKMFNKVKKLTPESHPLNKGVNPPATPLKTLLKDRRGSVPADFGLSDLSKEVKILRKGQKDILPDFEWREMVANQ